MWKGVIIKESLNENRPLNKVETVEIKESFLENEKQKGLLHLHKILVDDSEKPSFVKAASKAIKQGFYIHICQGDKMVVIFKDKIFEFSDKDNERIEAAREYGTSIGILKVQMDFEYLLRNPYG